MTSTMYEHLRLSCGIPHGWESNDALHVLSLLMISMEKASFFYEFSIS